MDILVACVSVLVFIAALALHVRCRRLERRGAALAICLDQLVQRETSPHSVLHGASNVALAEWYQEVD